METVLWIVVGLCGAAYLVGVVWLIKLVKDAPEGDEIPGVGFVEKEKKRD